MWHIKCLIHCQQNKDLELKTKGIRNKNYWNFGMTNHYHSTWKILREDNEMIYTHSVLFSEVLFSTKARFSLRPSILIFLRDFVITRCIIRLVTSFVFHPRMERLRSIDNQFKLCYITFNLMSKVQGSYKGDFLTQNTMIKHTTCKLSPSNARWYDGLSMRNQCCINFSSTARVKNGTKTLDETYLWLHKFESPKEKNTHQIIQRFLSTRRPSTSSENSIVSIWILMSDDFGPTMSPMWFMICAIFSIMTVWFFKISFFFKTSISLSR